MNEKKTIYKLWLHAEEIQQDENGKDLYYQNLDDEFLPVLVSVCLKKSTVLNEMNSIENHNAAIELLQGVLCESSMESDYDKSIYTFLKELNLLRKGYTPYWDEGDRSEP